MYGCILGAEFGFWPNGFGRVHVYSPHLPPSKVTLGLGLWGLSQTASEIPLPCLRKGN